MNEADHIFTSTARGSSSDNPTDPQSLTAEQASKGIQFFFRSRDAQRQSFELHPTLARLRDDGARDTFVCTLLAHLAWKARALTEGR